MSRPRVRSSERWVTVNHLSMYTREFIDLSLQKRPFVTLVPGLSMSSSYMLPTAYELASTFPVYAPDLPGFGKSDKPCQAMSIPKLADTLARWMDALGLEQTAMLGNSFGCQLIVEFGLRHPQRLTHAVLVGPTVDPASRSILRQLFRAAGDVLHEPLALLPLVGHDYLIAGLRRTWQTFRALLQDKIEAKLPEVHVPTLVVRGENDTIVSQRWAEEVTRLLPRAKLVTIPNAAHAANYSASRELARISREFLNNPTALSTECRRVH